jgi:hypothetical protein
LDDMIGVPEREDARIIPISAHPNFRDHTIPEIVIGGDEGYSETYEGPDGVDDAMMEIMEGAVGAELEERNAIGNDVCWQCTHRMDVRPWWKKALFAADESSFECAATSRTQVTDPVTGHVKYIERIKGVMGAALALVDRPRRLCVEVNPDGKCFMFNIAVVGKKKRRKE